MKISVDTKYLKDLFDTFVSKSKVIFNFKFDHVANVIDVQLLDSYTVNTSIPYECLDNTDGIDDISFFVDKTIAMLDVKEKTTITIENDFVVFTQSNYRSVHTREYEARKELNFSADKEYAKLNVIRLKSIISAGVACNAIVKELAITQPDFIVANNKAYLDYRQSVIIDKIELPDMVIPFDVLRSVVYKLENEAEYCYDSTVGILIIRSSRYEIWLQVTQRSIDPFIKVIDAILSSCNQVANISFKDHKSKLDIFTDAFPKQKVWFSFEGDKFCIEADKNTSRCVIGIYASEANGIEVTSGHIAAMHKIFSDGDVSICISNKGICLQKGERCQIIAGTVYRTH